MYVNGREWIRQGDEDDWICEIEVEELSAKDGDYIAVI